MTQLYQNKTKKTLLNLLALILLAGLVVLEEIVLERTSVFFFTNISRFFLYVILAMATTFSIHSWVVLPKYFQNHIKEYKYWSVGLLVTFILSELYFFLEMLYFSVPIKFLKIKEVPLLFGLEFKHFILLITCISFSALFLVFLNFLYSSFFIKKIRFRLLEYIVNVVFFTLLLAVAFSRRGPEVVMIALMSAAVFYIHTFFLFPMLFKNKKYKYLWSLLILSVAFVLIIKGCFIAYEVDTNKDVIKLIGVFLVALFLSFVYGYFRTKVINKEKLFSLELENKDSELSLLKSQVNPHFLFNTLNTLYALALNENAPKTADTTAKLANLLRYMETDMKKEHIPITNEIKYIEDYIAIQKTRCSVEPDIHFTTKNVSETARISPGLFIPLVENAFKHGIHLLEKGMLTISVACDEKNIHFSCANTYDEVAKVHQMEKGFGIGIQNVQKRLELLYGQDYTFEIDKQNRIFTVKLSIPKR